MPSNTTRMGIPRPILGDAADVTGTYDALTVIDGFPGIKPVADATARAALTWGAGQAGMIIIQTDQKTLWYWTGTAFERYQGRGMLGSADITSDFATALTTAQTAISCAVTVPETHSTSTTARIRVIGSFYAIDNGTLSTLGACEVSLLRDPGAVVLKKFRWPGRPDTAAAAMDWGGGGSIEGLDTPAVAGGSYTYRLCVNSIAAVGGTSTLRAAASYPATLSVEEVGV